YQSVASRTGLSVAQLQSFNSGVDLNKTTKLVVPNSNVRLTKWVRATNGPEAAATQPALGTVRARKGETIASIAAARNLDANDVARLNGITVNAELRAGQVIKVPATQATVPSRRR
ncbi:MAG TPA: LysM peptidoglycan-binding domain-containing protein, partial [Pyrinomonadaceae bacterium]